MTQTWTGRNRKNRHVSPTSDETGPHGLRRKEGTRHHPHAQAATGGKQAGRRERGAKRGGSSFQITQAGAVTNGFADSISSQVHGSCDTNGAHRGVEPESTGGGRATRAAHTQPQGRAATRRRKEGEETTQSWRGGAKLFAMQRV